MSFDLLSTVEHGGCSAKLPAQKLSDALKGLPKIVNKRLLVGIETHDDAGVYKLTDDIAVILTTDFFPPVCSDPFEFGQIAAANALSDVYAMGGKAIAALNLCMFPSSKISLDVLREILAGGLRKIKEAGAVVAGGHTIDDYPPKYGLAVTGVVHPNKIITNDRAKPGDALILTKPLGAGVMVAGRRVGDAKDKDYEACLDNMKLLNKAGAEVMRKYGVRCATDITGFGLLGHGLKMAQASGVTLELDSEEIPVLAGAYELAESGCIPGAAFRNQEFVEKECLFEKDVDYSMKMLCLDAQTSGGLLLCAPEAKADRMKAELIDKGYARTQIVGRVIKKGRNGKSLVVKE
ncbi:MAG TPA: selenide, water dikinase SelD [Chitinivibrionales bacterium]|nr:selenide, water dikinase SelD [Chitinivibrionales bacterium]